MTASRLFIALILVALCALAFQSPSREFGAEVSIKDRMKDVAKEERANFKSAEVVKKLKEGFYDVPYQGHDYRIELVRFSSIEGGVEVYARAWENGEQIGFGDGSVDIERFRIFNPPILVPDGEELVPTASSTPYRVPKYKEDPQQAVLLSLAQAISVKKEKHGPERIELLKVGRTTSTFRPDPNVESTSVDGWVEIIGVWATIRVAATGDTAADTTAGPSYAGTQANSPGLELDRAFFLFDTSAITDTDVISSGTITLTNGSNAESNADSITYHIVSSTPASNTAITTADLDQVGSVSFGSLALSSVVDNAANNWTLNASGIAAITTTGVSKFAMLTSSDLNNSAPTGVNRFDILYADASGTTNDPLLTVEHAAPANVAPEQIILFE